LRKARGLAERFELRRKCSLSADLHRSSSYRRVYGRRTPAVRPLSVVGRALAPDTGGMPGNARSTVFVTGAAGFIGMELAKVLVARGDQVFGLAGFRFRYPNLEQGTEQVVGALHE
jgi:hypothetical protein